jgi:hypothetical protein
VVYAARGAVLGLAVYACQRTPGAPIAPEDASVHGDATANPTPSSDTTTARGTRGPDGPDAAPDLERATVSARDRKAVVVDPSHAAAERIYDRAAEALFRHDAKECRRLLAEADARDAGLTEYSEQLHASCNDLEHRPHDARRKPSQGKQRPEPGPEGPTTPQERSGLSTRPAAHDR